jgi:hypothetical protein
LQNHRPAEYRHRRRSQRRRRARQRKPIAGLGDEDLSAVYPAAGMFGLYRTNMVIMGIYSFEAFQS